MNYYHQIKYSLFDAKQMLLEGMTKYKTTSSKKSYLTRSIKQHEDYLKDITECVADGKSRGKIYGWFHGEIFQSYHVKFYTRELQMMQAMRLELNEGKESNAFDNVIDADVIKLYNDLYNN